MTEDVIVTFNCGSDTMKLGCFKKSDMTRLWYGLCERINTAPEVRIKSDAGEVLLEKTGLPAGYDNAVNAVLEWMDAQEGIRPIVFAHRVVHGGKFYKSSIIVTPEALDRMESLRALAPLHQPHNVLPQRILAKLKPDIPQVACFDTAFHTTQPEVSMRYAIPKDLYEEGIQKYGFHGLSYHYISTVMGDYLPDADKKKILVCHLGNGSSLCAIKEGKSVASTMGFSAVEGLMMGTRTGKIDPGVILHLMMEKGMTPKDVETLIYKKSGLLGVSGVSNDMRDLLESDNPDAAFAVELYCHMAVRQGGEMATVMGGLDGVIFTAGVGENAAPVREKICAGFDFLGVKIDPEKNNTRGTRDISTPGAKVPVFVIPTNEELIMAKEAKRLAC